MSFEIWWLLFGVPLLTMLIAWISLVSRWYTVSVRALRLLASIAMIFPTAAALLACGGFAYVEHGGRVDDALGFYFDILLLSLAGFAVGTAATIALRRWFCFAALAVSTWLLLLSGLMASAAD